MSCMCQNHKYVALHSSNAHSNKHFPSERNSLDSSFCWQDEEEEEALVGDISTSPEPKLRKLAPLSEDESLVSSKPAAASAKKIVLNRNVVASAASSEKENHQQQTAQGISDTGQQPQRQHQQQSDGKKVIKLSAFSMKEVRDVLDQY